MAPTLKIKVLEQSQVSPPPDTVPKLSLPLTFFDIPWLKFWNMQCLFMYSLPHSKEHVLRTIIPDLKASLSLTLKHLPPVAGNLLLPFNSGMPELCYMAGDSVSLVIAECDYDFNFLKGNHPRKADDFYPLFQELPSFANDSHCQKISAIALQVTIFPNVGITIGLVFSHAMGDGNTIGEFIKIWTSINRLNGKGMKPEFLPCFDRSHILDSGGRRAQNSWSGSPLEWLKDAGLHSDKVRSTYVLSRENIGRMKKLVREKNPELVRVSSFMVTCAYVWTCILKSAVAIGEEVDMNEPKYFCFAADCRDRLNPPLPENYFGNCIFPLTAKITHAQLVGDEGFVNATVSIGKAIQKLVPKEGESLDFGSFVSECLECDPLRAFGVSGSPKFDGYEADFGWGKPEKFEIISIDYNGVMSLMNDSSKSGGLEVGLSLSKIKMEAFDNFFKEGLRILEKNADLIL